MCWVNFPPVTGGGKFAAGFLGWALCLAAWLMLSTMAAIGAPTHPITDVGVDVTFDFDNDGERDATYEHQGMPNGGDTSYYTVVFFLRPLSQLRLVQASKQQIDYRIGEQVSAASLTHVNSGNGNDVTLLGYDADSRFGPWIYYDITVGSKNMFFTNKTEVLVGFRPLLSGYKSLKTNWLQTSLFFISEGTFANS